MVLGIATTGFHGAETIFDGVVSFSVMVIGGVAFGIFMGFLFAKILEKVEEDEHAEVTITMLVAHLTFILSEFIAHSLSIGGHAVHLSSIIATVMASMVIGNYGRSKISPRVESFLERYWGISPFSPTLWYSYRWDCSSRISRSISGCSPCRCSSPFSS